MVERDGMGWDAMAEIKVADPPSQKIHTHTVMSFTIF
jgi:hypothetical protein